MTDLTPNNLSESIIHPTKEISEPTMEEGDRSDKGEKETSDGEAGERPVREKLKKTSIAALSQQVGENGTGERSNEANIEETTLSDARGRPTRKRSFEDLQQEEIQTHQEVIDKAVSPNRNSAHKRMRSRDVTDAENVPLNTRNQSTAEEAIQEEAQPLEESNSTASTSNPENLHQMGPTQASRIPNGDEIMSPKKKRSRDQFDKDQNTTQDNASEASSEHSAMSGSDGADGSDAAPKATSKFDAGEPEKKRHRDESRDGEKIEQKIPPPSGFGNTSTVSPFGALAPSKDEKETEADPTTNQKENQTASSAFAASGLSAFAKSDSSPFGAATLKSNTGFGGGTKSGFGFGSTSGFGSASGFGGTSSFAAARPSGSSGGFGNGFGGGFSGGLGSAKPLGGLSSFVSPTGTGGIIGTSNTKAFGAPEGEESEEDEDGDSDQSNDESHEDRQKEKRFVEQDVNTGEEDEETVFSCKGKLFHFDGEWKERGAGTFKVNVHENENAENVEPKIARLIMRTEGVYRVVLNTPIFKGMKVGSNDGEEPSGKMLNLVATENGKLVPLVLRTGNVDMARTLYHKITEIQQELPETSNVVG